MPYIFVEELGEGQEEAEVVTQAVYAQLEADYETLKEEKSGLDESIEKLGNENRGLQQSLDDAKRKFAESFLSAQERKAETKAEEPSYVPASIDSLFQEGEK